MSRKGYKDKKKLYYTWKEEVFDYLDAKYLEIREGREEKCHQIQDLYKAFPDMKEGTLRNYLREWRLLKRDLFAILMPKIEKLLYVLSFKFSPDKQLSIEEQKVIEDLGKYVDHWRKGGEFDF